MEGAGDKSKRAHVAAIIGWDFFKFSQERLETQRRSIWRKSRKLHLSHDRNGPQSIGRVSYLTNKK